MAQDDPRALVDLAIQHYIRLELDRVIEFCEQAIELAPDLPGAHFQLAEACLLRGEFERGWEEYEWRYRIPGAGKEMPRTDRPQWDGQALGDRRLLLIADQGAGDAIQFCRYIPWAAARAPNLVIASASPALTPILERQAGVLHMVETWNQVGPFAAYCPLSGLPRLAGARLETIPGNFPYIEAEPVRNAAWAERLASLLPRGRKRVGIVWAGSPTHNKDRRRSMALSDFAPLTDIPGVALAALQKGPAQAQIARYFGRAPLINLGPALTDYRDTAAALDHLDLVVTVDTSVAHLAGAMGRKVWILLPFAPDWRWLLDRADSPWYGTARLFRQKSPGDWGPVMEEVAAALRQEV